MPARDSWRSAASERPTAAFISASWVIWRAIVLEREELVDRPGQVRQVVEVLGSWSDGGAVAGVNVGVERTSAETPDLPGEARLANLDHLQGVGDACPHAVERVIAF